MVFQSKIFSRIRIFLMMVMCSVVVSSCGADDPIVGKWESTSYGAYYINSAVFYSNHKVSIRYRDNDMGAYEMLLKGHWKKGEQGTYRVTIEENSFVESGGNSATGTAKFDGKELVFVNVINHWDDNSESARLRWVEAYVDE